MNLATERQPRWKPNKESILRQRARPGPIVPAWNPNLLADDPIQLGSSNRVIPGKSLATYIRRRRHAATDRSARKLQQAQLLELGKTMRETLRESTEPVLIAQNTMRKMRTAMSKEVYMSPVNFQGPAGGVMTQSFEEELERRVEQANPGEEPWQSVWSRTLLCNRCEEFCSAVEGGCVCCNLVVHYVCMTDYERLLLRDGEFMCDVCQAFRKENEDLFNFWKEKLKKLRWEKACVNKVAKVLKRNMCRLRFVRMRRAAQLLQNSVKRYLFWRRILKFRRNMVRPVTVRILSVEGLASPFKLIKNSGSYLPNPYVIMTVMDLFGRVQHFKFKGKELKQCVDGEFDDEFLIPGSNANVLLVFTVVHKRRSEEPLQKDVFLGQAVLTLQSIVALSINDKTCTLDLRDIEYVPMETPYSEVKMDALANFQPTGKLRVNVRPFLSTYGQVANVFGPALDVWKRKATHISALEAGTDMGRKSRWFMVLADGRIYVFKKEGQTDAKVTIDTREFMTMQLEHASLSIAIYLYDRTRLGLVFETHREMVDWWFALMLSVSMHKGMTLQRFVGRILPRPDFWCDGALVAATAIGAIEKRARQSSIMMNAPVPPPSHGNTRASITTTTAAIGNSTASLGASMSAGKDEARTEPVSAA